MATCSLCGVADGAGPCVTASSRHMYELGVGGVVGDPEPMPEVLRAALTDPQLRTPEQHELLRGDS